MSKFELKSPFLPAGDQPGAIKKLVNGVEDGLKSQTLLGVTGSGKTFTIANLIAQTQRPALIMAPNKTLVSQLYAEFKELFPENAVEIWMSTFDYYQPESYLPATDLYIERDSTRNEEIERLRASAMRSLMSRKDVIVVSSVSCIYGIGSPEDWMGESLQIKLGESIRREYLQRKLISLNYERNDMSLSRSKFRIRGEIVDVHPVYDENPIRLTFFGNELEKITEFDSLTGKVIKTLDSFQLFPATEYVTTTAKLQRALGEIAKEMEERCANLDAQDKILESQRLRQRTLNDLEMLQETGICSGIENYSRHLSGRKSGEAPYTLMDYMEPETLYILDESHVSCPQIGAMYAGDHSRKMNLVEYGFRLPSALDNRPLTFDEWKERTGQVIYVSATPGPYEIDNSQQLIEQIIRPTGLVDPVIEVRPSKGQIDDIIFEIGEKVKNGERVLVLTLTKRMAEDLTDYLKDSGIKTNYMHSDIDTMARIEIIRDLRLGLFDVLVGINLLREGLDLPEVGLICILDSDKTGFLRSAKSLIQIIGRTARNLSGKVLMYADVMTDAMKEAIEETERRRNIQLAHNLEHGITATTIKKAIYNLEVHQEEIEERMEELEMKTNMTPIEIIKQSQKIERAMKKAAKELQFEEAARLRDQLMKLKETHFEKPASPRPAYETGSYGKRSSFRAKG
jgi:excinuclease ABC subunit B